MSLSKFDCNFCKKSFGLKGNLIFHQKNTKACLEIQGKIIEAKIECKICNKKFTLKDSYNKHYISCMNNPIFLKLTNTLVELEEIKKENFNLSLKIKELKDDFKERETNYEKRITELESHLADIALKASTKPTTSTTNNTKIKTLNHLQPINFEEIKEKSSELTIEHIKRGIEGYIDHITPQLEGKISCPDVSRKIIKYKNSDNQIITDLEGAVITKKICGAIKDTNNDLIKQYSNEMYEKMQTSDLEGKYDETAKLLNEGSKVLDAAIQVNTAAKGEKTELGDNIVKQMCLLGSKIA